MQDQGADVRDPDQGQDQPGLPADGRNPAEGNLHGRHPAHDRAGNLHHQRRRARGGQPDPPLARRDLLARERRLRLADHPLPRLLAGVRDRPEEGVDLRQDRPQEAPAGDGVPARAGIRQPRSDRRLVLPAHHHAGIGRPGGEVAACGQDPGTAVAPRRHPTLPGRREAAVPRRRGAGQPAGARGRGHRLRPSGQPALTHRGQLLRARGDQAGPQRRRRRDDQGRRGDPRLFGHQAGRAGHDRERGEGPAQHVLLLAPLRPGTGRALQAQQEVRLRRAPGDAHAGAGGHRQHDDHAHQGLHRRRQRRRHRPPGQSPHPLGRRAPDQPSEDRLLPHGAHRQGAHVAEGGGHDPAAGSGVDQADRCHHQGVLRIQPALAVHGAGQPACGADPQEAAERARPRRPVTGPRRLRGARRPLHPLRTHVPDRDPGRTEHRVDRVAGQLHARQLLRLPGDSVPQGGRRPRHARDRVPVGDRRREVLHRPGRRAGRR